MRNAVRNRRRNSFGVVTKNPQWKPHVYRVPEYTTETTVPFVVQEARSGADPPLELMRRRFVAVDNWPKTGWVLYLPPAFFSLLLPSLLWSYLIVQSKIIVSLTVQHCSLMVSWGDLRATWALHSPIKQGSQLTSHCRAIFPFRSDTQPLCSFRNREKCSRPSANFCTLPRMTWVSLTFIWAAVLSL